MNQFDPKRDPLALELDWRTPSDKPLVWDDPQTYTGDDAAADRDPLLRVDPPDLAMSSTR